MIQFKYLEKAEPLTRLTKKNEHLVREVEQQPPFQIMVTTIMTPPVPRYFDHGREVIIEMDVSGYVSAGVLSQYNNEGVLHPVALYSKRHTPAECNYEIYNKELMAIIKALEEWRPKCEGAAYSFQL